MLRARRAYNTSGVDWWRIDWSTVSFAETDWLAIDYANTNAVAATYTCDATQYQTQTATQAQAATPLRANAFDAGMTPIVAAPQTTMQTLTSASPWQYGDVAPAYTLPASTRSAPALAPPTTAAPAAALGSVAGTRIGAGPDSVSIKI